VSGEISIKNLFIFFAFITFVLLEICQASAFPQLHKMTEEICLHSETKNSNDIEYKECMYKK
jgi:hypothetical protein